MTCPFCKREAPVVYRGAIPQCTACGAIRMPLSGTALNLAGKPAKIGGAVTRAIGWLFLLVGLAMALAIGMLLWALTTIAVALAIALPVALVVLVGGIALVRGGRSLVRSGVDAQRAMHEVALMALASHRGSVTAHDAAGALGVGVEEADAMLTAMAKQQPERLAVDIDDQGAVWFRAVDVVGSTGPGVRVADEGGVRVSPPGEELEAEQGEEAADLRR